MVSMLAVEFGDRFEDLHNTSTKNLSRTQYLMLRIANPNTLIERVRSIVGDAFVLESDGASILNHIWKGRSKDCSLAFYLFCLALLAKTESSFVEQS